MAKVRDGLSYVGVNDNGTPTEYIIRKINIGDWNMDATVSKTVAHGLTSTQWKTVSNLTAIIRNDTDTAYYPLSLSGINGTNPSDAGITFVDSTNINLTRFGGGGYDNTNFDSTSYNRGWITFMYIP
jgi:hypothetical protein